MKNTCCFTGHRPNKLYGYDLGDKNYQILARQTINQILYLIKNWGVDTFITGGALGFDTVAFFAVEHVKKTHPNIKNKLAIPLPNQSERWKNPIDIDRYNRMLSLADEVIQVYELEQYSSNTIPGKLNRRNDYMVDNSKFIICAWNGTPGGTNNAIKSAQNKNLVMFNVLKP